MARRTTPGYGTIVDVVQDGAGLFPHLTYEGPATFMIGETHEVGAKLVSELDSGSQKLGVRVRETRSFRRRGSAPTRRRNSSILFEPVPGRVRRTSAGYGRCPP